MPGSLDEKPEQQPTTTPVLASEHGVAYVRGPAGSAGFLFFVREQTLMVQPFDDQTLSLSGDPTPIDRVTTVNNYPAFSVSRNGRLAYRSGRQSTSQQLTWFDRTGKPLGTVGDPGAHEQLALSPDAAHAAYRDGLGTRHRRPLGRGSGPRRQRAIHVRSIRWEVFRSGRLTAATSSFVRETACSRRRRPAEERAELLLRMQTQTIPSSWSPDGRFLLLTVLGTNTLQDIRVLPMQGERQLFPFVRHAIQRITGQFLTGRSLGGLYVE